jgi:peptidoglycan/xylan/chitin deacetylase (PgdA/CDA1 family)
MRLTFKQIVLHLSKALGLFRVSRRFTRRGLRILCYHGFAVDDEHLFRPMLFIRRPSFEKRMQHLKEARYPVLSLGEAIERLDRGDLPDACTVITIDDGWAGTFNYGATILRQNSFPATLYVTTYFSVKQTPVFMVAVQYAFWKTSASALDLADLNPSLSGTFSMRDTKEKERAEAAIIEHGNRSSDNVYREKLLQRLCERLAVDYQQLQESRKFHLITQDQIHELSKTGMDIQIHTHRHQLPVEEAGVLREIADNRSVLEPLTGRRLEHLCYPSGVWSKTAWPWLLKAGVQTAVTCNRGMNYVGAPRLALLRLLDDQTISEIEFEAEMAGFLEILRLARSGVVKMFGKPEENLAPQAQVYP